MTGPIVFDPTFPLTDLQKNEILIALYNMAVNGITVNGDVIIDESTLATSENQTDGSQKTQIVDNDDNTLGSDTYPLVVDNGSSDDVSAIEANTDKIAWLESYLQSPLWYDRTLAALRVFVQNTLTATISSGTVTTVSTLTNQSQKATFDLGVTEMRWGMNKLWDNSIRERIV
jgi:hypothetical protein